METKHCVFDLLSSLGFSLSERTTAFEYDQVTLKSLCLSLSPLFEKAKQAHPQHSEENVLLGLITLHHGQVFKQLEAQKHSLTAMRGVIDASLDEHYSAAFKAPIVEEFWLVMHLWLFVQGRLNMDYSLANDYATVASNRLSPFTGASADALRCEWNQSFYQGIHQYKQSLGDQFGLKRFLSHLFKRD